MQRRLDALGSLLLTAALLIGICGRMEAQESLSRFDAAQVVLGPTDAQFQRLLDLDGDGTLDALGMRGGGSVNRIELHRNLGDGRFTSVWSHDLSWAGGQNQPSNLTPIAVGDFDNDGRRDDFAVAPGNWIQSFRFQPILAVLNSIVHLPGIARDMKSRDLDLDGKDDLIVLGDGFIAVVLDPSGGFPTLLVSTHAPSSAQNATVIPILLANGDTALFAAGMVVLYSPGAGLSPGPFLNAPAGPFSYGGGASGDIDGDGDEDGLFVQSHRYFVIRQGPGSTLSIGPAHDNGLISELVDLDGDGDLDGVYAGGGTFATAPGLIPNHNDGYFLFSENDGSGNFAAPRIVRGLGIQRLAGVSDIDSDGDLDFVAGRSVLFGRSESVFERPSSEKASPQFGVNSLNNFVDLDDDGDLDAGLSETEIHRNDGAGNLKLDAPTWLGTRPTPFPLEGFAMADWNGDGTKDVIVRSGSAAYLAYNLGGGTLAWYPAPVAGSSASLAFGSPRAVLDLDGDGDIDCAGNFFSAFDTTLVTSFNDGGNGFTAGPAFSNLMCLGAADFDGDGLVDLLARDAVPAQSSGALSWLRQFPAGSFGSPTTIQANLSVLTLPLIHDLDGDGDPDVVSFEDGVGHLLFTNDGAGNFSQSVVLAVPTLTSYLVGQAVADVNGDGAADLLLSPTPDAHIGTIALLASGGSFVPDTVTHAFVPEIVADLDGDGDLDILDQDYATIQRNLMHDGPDAGFRRQFGLGTGGSAGLVPTLGAGGPFREGSVATLRLRNALGQATAFFAFSTVGAPQPDYPLVGHHSVLDPFAPTSLIWPAVTLGGIPNIEGTGTLDLSFAIPVGLAGFEFFHQAYVLDPQGPSGASSTEGLVIRYGL